MLALRSLLDFEILEFSNFWFPAISITVVTSLVVFSVTSEFNFKKTADYLIATLIMGYLFVYSYGGIINYNCFYDKSDPQIFTSEILDMRISSGKITSYYIELKPWGAETEIDEVSISKGLYEMLVVGEMVNVSLKEGTMGIPWFSVAKNSL